MLKPQKIYSSSIGEKKGAKLWAQEVIKRVYRGLRPGRGCPALQLFPCPIMNLKKNFQNAPQGAVQPLLRSTSSGKITYSLKSVSLWACARVLVRCLTGTNNVERTILFIVTLFSAQPRKPIIEPISCSFLCKFSPSGESGGGFSSPTHFQRSVLALLVQEFFLLDCTL